MELIVNNGKVIEPGAVKKAVAKAKRDVEATITLSHTDVAQMLLNKLYAETPWLQTYTHGRLLYEAGMFTIVFSKEPKE